MLIYDPLYFVIMKAISQPPIIFASRRGCSIEVMTNPEKDQPAPGSESPGLNPSQRAEVAARMPLVNQIAADYFDRGLPVDELVRAGVFGLELGVCLNACPPGVDIDSYLAHWIRSGVIGALVADQAVGEFTDGFVREYGRRPNLAEIRGYGSAESDRMESEVSAYVRVVNDFVDVYSRDFGHMPTITEAEAFGQARRQQLRNRLGAYISEFLVADQPLVEAEFEAGPLYIPSSWLAGLTDEASQVLILRYGLDGSGVRETRKVGWEIRQKTRRVGELINQAITHLAEKNGIASEQLLVYPQLFNNMEPAQQGVLAMRLGVLGNPPMEVREVAEKLGVSCETVRTLEWQALCYARENAKVNLQAAPVGGARPDPV